MLRFTQFIAFSGIVALASSAWAIDLTTNTSANEQTESARYGRYTVGLGSWNGDTIVNDSTSVYDGAYDYASSRSGGRGGWALNDDNLGTYVSTLKGLDDEDFVGYRFKRPATITEINWQNRTWNNGGSFAAEPLVQVLVGGPMETGGAWQTIAVTFDTPYDTSYDNTTRGYTITPDAPTGEVWGVRLIGAPYVGDNPSPNDANGFIGTCDLRVLGASSIAAKVDLSTNLALNQTPIWTHEDFTHKPMTEFNRPEVLTDGDVSRGALSETAFYDTTYLEGTTASEERIGVMFDTPQTNVTAVGIAMMFFDTRGSHAELNKYTGGWIAAADIDVKYTTDNGDSWQSVANLDTGRLGNMESDLENELWWAYIHSELLMFDPIEEAIDGICMTGPAVVRPSEGDNDSDGFVGAVEFEAFAAASTQRIPGDADGDNYVDEDDAAVLAQHWGKYDPETIGWEEGDFNGDFRVNVADAAILAANWNPAPGEGGAAAPEPGAAALLLGLALGLLARRARR
jgi:hypothetical protein